MTTQGDGTPGGYRKPARPAAVSAPQSGARTDGGPADKQPIRTPTGGAYGEAKALTEQQQGAPMAAGGSGLPAPGPGVNPTAPPPGAGVPQGVFGPTTRPDQSIETGLPVTQQGQEIPPDMVIRELIQRYPSPYLTRLLRG